MLNELKQLLELLPSIIRIVDVIVSIILKHKKNSRPR